MFVRYESFQQFIRYYPVVTWIVGINTTLYLISFLFPSLYMFIQYFGIGWNNAVAQGEYWRLITPIFLHGGIGHFVFNTFALIIFGPALERILGRFKFLGLYLFAGFLGNMGTFLFQSGNYVHLGASGSIYGLLGLYLYMKYFRKDLIDTVSAQMVTTILIIGFLHTFVSPFIGYNINILGHLFGFIGGAIAGPILFKGKMKYFSMPSRSYHQKDEHEIGFDPQRWQKAKKRKQILKYVGLAILILLIFLGIWQRI